MLWEPMFKIGDQVAWELIDGRTMAGTVTDVSYHVYYVRRVDGTECNIAAERRDLRPATSDEVLKACEVFIRGPWWGVKV